MTLTSRVQTSSSEAPSDYDSDSIASGTVIAQTSHVTTVPNRCIITLATRPVEVCHVLSQTAPPQMTWKLEMMWGMEFGTLDLHTIRNMTCLTANMHRMFDENDWALVPKLDFLEKILLTKQSPNAITRFATYASSQSIDYHFVPFRNFPEALIRFDQHEESFQVYRSPFDNFPNVMSHVHPFFVICNAAQKEIYHRDLDLKNGDMPTGLRNTYAQQLDACVVIYKDWLQLP
ncbi:hypothetical protein BDV93DRAFT_609260 [Ceratobasidium sp. AG-I]|nr:hypothetical protein BDV93DRAFT_609260 [Ceratobasidium sp. AG-I]